VAVLRRPAGRAFTGRKRTIVERVGKAQFVQDLAIAADEDGRATLAWSPETFGQGRSVGINGVTAAVHVATADPEASAFVRPKTLLDHGKRDCMPPSVAAAAGRAVVAFRCLTRTSGIVFAVSLDGGVPGPRSTVISGPIPSSFSAQRAALTAGLDTTGTATLIIVDPRPATVGLTTQHILASTGR
jgi:hypothetical protein